mmetsp:Transcript_95156/g.266462  ORF Transcript_95156/g.266462 Transcript_95156/m.266462 type:complete len:223 (-) Transcript_95156:29-697(-)
MMKVDLAKTWISSAGHTCPAETLKESIMRMRFPMWAARCDSGLAVGATLNTTAYDSSHCKRARYKAIGNTCSPSRSVDFLRSCMLPSSNFCAHSGGTNTGAPLWALAATVANSSSGRGSKLPARRRNGEPPCTRASTNLALPIGEWVRCPGRPRARCKLMAAFTAGHSAAASSNADADAAAPRAPGRSRTQRPTPIGNARRRKRPRRRRNGRRGAIARALSR